MEVPDWVLYRVVGSKQEDWRLYREGWLNTSEAMRKVNPGVEGVYVTQYNELKLLAVTEFSPPAKPLIPVDQRICPSLYVQVKSQEVTKEDLDRLRVELQKVVLELLQEANPFLPYTDVMPEWWPNAFEEAYQRVMAGKPPSEITSTVEGEVK